MKRINWTKEWKNKKLGTDKQSLLFFRATKGVSKCKSGLGSPNCLSNHSHKTCTYSLGEIYYLGWIEFL